MQRVLIAVMAAMTVLSTLARGEYIPIAIGDEWTMAATMVSPTGQVTKGHVRRRIERATEKDGKAYVRSRTWTVGMQRMTESTKLLRKDEKAVYSIDESNGGSAEQIEVVLPLKPGITWQQTVGSKTMTNSVVGLETIEVSGKTYENCFHIHISSADGSYTEDFWEAPRVGDIKSIIAYGNGATLTLTIEEFKSGD
jgi:hypothetical protein